MKRQIAPELAAVRHVRWPRPTKQLAMEYGPKTRDFSFFNFVLEFSRV